LIFYTSIISFFIYTVTCPMPISDPTNGIIGCSLGDDGVLTFQDTCTVTCNTGYMVTGDDMRACLSDGMLNGTMATCDRGGLPENSWLKIVW